MKLFLLIIECISGLSLIVAILLHSAKGEGLGAIGGQARMFSPQKGLEDGLNRVTIILASVFLLSAAIFGIFF